MVPINDIRGVESMGYAKGEKIIRCKLAAVFRLMDLYGWTQGIYNQVSVIISFIPLLFKFSYFYLSLIKLARVPKINVFD